MNGTLRPLFPHGRRLVFATRGVGVRLTCACERTFTAEIRRSDGTVVRLGIFTGSDISFSPRRWDLRDAFEGAAHNAADQLWSTLVKRDLLPAVAA